LGAKGAAQLYQRLLHQALDTCVQAAIGEVLLWCAPPINEALLALGRAYGVSVREQCDGDLGKRMASALDALLATHRYALLIGSDCPSRTSADLQEARAALYEGYDAVVGPVEDGGYHLIGLRRSHPDLFSQMVWSTGSVMYETRQRMQQYGLRWRELPMRWDVDREADVHRLHADPALAFLVEGVEGDRMQ
jgi:hypothetical protein